MDILNDLNERQKEAVCHYQGPLLVLAGPGSGKTRVITHRIAYLIRGHNVDPQRILAVTFTNKAAIEMFERVKSLLGDTALDVWISTFHTACVKILREHSQDAGLDENFAIIAEKAQQEIIEEVVRFLNLSLETYPVWMLQSIISLQKSQLEEQFVLPRYEFSIEEHLNAQGISLEDLVFIQNITQIFEEYQNVLKRYRALDFDDLMLETVRLLERDSQVRSEYRRKFRYLTVDEFQDINRVQYELLKLLSSSSKNVMVVADDDQSIYSWRGSSPKFIENFNSDFAPKKIELKEQYRLPQKILRASQALISQNSRQKEAALESGTAVGHAIFHYCVDTADDELELISKLLGQLLEKRHYSPGDLAIFYRTHRIADRLEEHLLRDGIQVQRIRSDSSFKGENAREVISYLRFLNWGLDFDLEKAVNFPQRRIDELTMAKLKDLARRKGLTLKQLLYEPSLYKDVVGKLTSKWISNFIQTLEKFRQTIGEQSASHTIVELFKFLDSQRNQYRKDELDAISHRETSGLRMAWEAIAHRETSGLRMAVDTIYSSINRAEKIKIISAYGIDNYCAASLIKFVLKSYFDLEAEVKLLMKEESAEPQEDESLYILIGEGSIRISKDHSTITLFGNEAVASVSALILGQRLLSYFEQPDFNNLIVYDIETIGSNPKYAEVLEIAAMKLNSSGNPVEQYHSLVKPKGAIPRSASKIHGIYDKDVKLARPIEEILPEFLDFIKDGILVGHNIGMFDNRVIDREMGRCMKRGLSNLFYDTYTTAKRLYPRENCNLGALAKKFEIEHDPKELHHALSDIEVTRRILEATIKEDIKLREKESLQEFLPLVGLAILSKDVPIEGELEAYYRAGVRYLEDNVPKGELEFVVANLLPPEVEKVNRLVRTLRRAELPQSLEDASWKSFRGRLMNSVLNFEVYSFDKSLSAFLDYEVLVSGVDELESGLDKITMMTLHSAKGTEFRVVIMIGMEEGNFPLLRKESPPEFLEEERRLCYVGMTRTLDRLYLVSANRRDSDRERDFSRFISEIPSNLIKRYYKVGDKWRIRTGNGQ